MAWFNLVTTGFWLLGTLAALSKGQEFGTLPDTTTVGVLGNNVTFPCGVTNLSTGQYVSWVTDAGTKITENATIVISGGRYEVDMLSSDNEVIFKLKLTNVMITDPSSFGCKIHDSDDREIKSKFFELRVVYFPSDEFPQCSPPNNFTVTEGEDTNLVCESELGQPTVGIAWRLDGSNIGGLVSSTSSDRISLPYSFTVNREHDGTEYICRIVSPVQFSDLEGICTSGPMNVLYPPDEINISQETYDMYTAFRCDSPGNPAPTFSWSFNTPLTNSSYNITDNGKLLVILQTIECEDMDITATCTASNSEGNSSVSTNLCQVPTCALVSNPFNQTEGESVTVSCETNGNVEDLIWTRASLTGNMTEEELATVQNMAALDHEFTVNREHANTLYLCSAMNTSPPWIGTCQSGPLDNVFFPPDDVSIMSATKSEDGIQYESYWCAATGNPIDINYMWTTNLDPLMYEITDNNQNLKIKSNVTCNSTDIIATCTASNGIGSQLHKADITLCRVPICNPSEEVVTSEGSNTGLTCQHDANDPVDLTWSQDDMVVMTSSSATRLIHILTGHRNDTGAVFTCSTSHVSQPSYVGTCTSGPLTVHYPPEQTLIQPSQDGSYNCSAIGLPEASYSWTFNTSLERGEQYSIQDDGQRLVLLDVGRCESTIVATCASSNDLGTDEADFVICEQGTEIYVPHDKEGFEFTPLIIILIALGGFIVLVIIIALMVCAVRHSPLISVDVKKDEEEATPPGGVMATKLSLASELSMEMTEHSKVEPSKRESTASNDYAETPVPLQDIKEEDLPKEAEVEGQDNHGFSSFKGSDPDGENEAEKTKPDLLDYMTRPDSMDVDVTMGNEAVVTETEGEPETVNEDAVESNPADVAPVETSTTEEPAEESDLPNESPGESSMNKEESPEDSSPGESSKNKEETPDKAQIDSTTETPEDDIFKDVMNDIDKMLESGKSDSDRAKLVTDSETKADNAETNTSPDVLEL